MDDFWPVESAPAVRLHSLLAEFAEGECAVLGGATEMPAEAHSDWHLIVHRRSNHPAMLLLLVLRLLLRLVYMAGTHPYKAVIISVPKYELLAAALFLRLIGVPLVIDVRDTLEFLDYNAYLGKYLPRAVASPLARLARWLSDGIRQYALRTARLVTAANPAILAAVSEVNANACLVSNGVDTDHFTPLSGRTAGKILELVFVGNFSEKDDFSWISQAAAKFRGQVRLNLIGNGRHKRHVLSTLEGQVDFRDFGSLSHADLPRVLQEMDLGFIFRDPSVCASVPVSIYELCAMNIPVICNDAGIMAAFVREHKLGFVAGSAGETAALLENLTLNRTLLQAYGHLHAYAAEHFSRQAQARRFRGALLEPGELAKSVL